MSHTSSTMHKCLPRSNLMDDVVGTLEDIPNEVIPQLSCIRLVLSVASELTWPAMPAGGTWAIEVLDTLAISVSRYSPPG